MYDGIRGRQDRAVSRGSIGARGLAAVNDRSPAMALLARSQPLKWNEALIEAFKANSAGPRDLMDELVRVVGEVQRLR